MRSLAIAFAIATLVVACTKDKPGPSDASSSSVPVPLSTTSRDATTASGVLSREEGRALLKNACLSCHSEEMLMQQRLTLAQWTKVVDKMVSWGANLEPNDKEPLIAWLAATYFVDAGVYHPQEIRVGEAPPQIAALPDGAFANGDAERGKGIYTDKCSGCHGAEARGHIGVLLIDRPFLFRASEFAETIRRGRGKMTPLPSMTDAEVADILAHLRRLKN